jgi:hypothetical protein
MIAMPQGPGLGYAVPAEQLERYQVARQVVSA